MLTKDDLKAIEKIVEPLKENLDIHTGSILSIEQKIDAVKETLNTHTGSILSIEQKIDAALELRVDIKEVRDQVKDHETRVSQLETK